MAEPHKYQLKIFALVETNVENYQFEASTQKQIDEAIARRTISLPKDYHYVLEDLTVPADNTAGPSEPELR